MSDFGYGDDIDLTVTLELDDDTSVECDVILVFEIEEDEQEYVALYPSSGEPDEIYLMRCDYFDESTLEMEIESIDDDDEFELVSEAFDAIMEQEDWNDTMAEDD